MKKVLIIIALFASIGAKAQIQSGNIFFGGTFNLQTSSSSVTNINGATTTNTAGVSTFGFEINPNAGYMLTDILGLGLNLGYGLTKTTTPDFFDNGTLTFDQVQNNSSINITPYLRYYYSLSDKFYLYASIGIPVRITNSTYYVWNSTFDGVEKYSGEIKTFSLGLNSTMGASYFISPKISLETNVNLFGISYYNTKNTNTNANGDGNINNSSGFIFDFSTDNVINTGNISIGIMFFL